MADIETTQPDLAQPPNKPVTHSAPGLRRGWVELIGVVTLAVSVAALGFLSGVAPILEVSRQTLLDMALRLCATMLIGATLLVIALRQEGRKWRQVIIVPLVIVAVSMAVIYVPLFGYFSYLEAQNPLEYFRLFR